MKSFLLKVLVGVALLYAPLGVFAQGVRAGKDTLQGYILLILQFINNVLLPLLFSIALLFFLYNTARYFIFEGKDSKSREQARTMAIYGIAAFVIMVSIWGIVNMLVGGLGFDEDRPICPDYLGDWCQSGNTYDDAATEGFFLEITF